jgi:mannose-6-phosphate isomerase-like protein (cupin superfamily)
MAHAGDVLRNPVTGHEYRILQAASDTGGDLLDMEATFPLGGARPPLHLHPRQEERFEVLSGALGVVVRGQRRRLETGDTLVVPAGAPHAMWNAGDAPARVRWQTRPALRTERFFETLVALAAAGRVGPSGVPRPLELGLLMRAFAAEMRPASPPRAVQLVLFGALAGAARLAGRRLPERVR